MSVKQQHIRVLVIAAVRLYRDALVEALHRTDGVTVVAALADGADALARIRELAPTTVLLDMTSHHSYELVRDLGRTVPHVPIVGLVVGDSEDEIVACAEAGIAGCLAHDASLNELIQVVETTSNGGATYPTSLTAALMRRLTSLAGVEPPRGQQPRLSRRELEIANLLEGDLTNKEIAARLGIEVATVKNHVHNLLEKLSVHRRADAVLFLHTGRRRTRRLQTSLS